MLVEDCEDVDEASELELCKDSEVLEKLFELSVEVADDVGLTELEDRLEVDVKKDEEELTEAEDRLEIDVEEDVDVDVDVNLIEPEE